MIEIYIQNRDDPEAVEKTVKEIRHIMIEHADDVTCVYAHDDARIKDFEDRGLEVIHVRGE